MIPDHKLYFAEVSSRNEPHYLATFLNSRPVRTWLSKFLHGKQIATTIFEFVRVPQFEPINPDHQRLLAISVAAHRRAGTQDAGFLADVLEEELTTLVHRIAARQQPGPN